jgi:hypothetical protein
MRLVDHELLASPVAVSADHRLGNRSEFGVFER